MTHGVGFWTSFSLPVLVAMAGPCQAQSIAELNDMAVDTARASKALDRADAALLQVAAKIPSDGRGNAFPIATLREVAKAWRSYVVLQCRLSGAMTGGTSIAKSQYAVLCEAGRYTERTKLVVKATTCLSKAIGQEGEYPETCLGEIAPLLEG